ALLCPRRPDAWATRHKSHLAQRTECEFLDRIERARDGEARPLAPLRSPISSRAAELMNGLAGQLRSRVATGLTVLVLIVPAAVLARQATDTSRADADSEPSAPTSEWPLERVTLNDGKTYQGLVESENDSTIEFVEVHRPKGKPMFLVVRTV